MRVTRTLETVHAIQHARPWDKTLTEIPQGALFEYYGRIGIVYLALANNHGDPAYVIVKSDHESEVGRVALFNNDVLRHFRIIPDDKAVLHIVDRPDLPENVPTVATVPMPPSVVEEILAPPDARYTFVHGEQMVSNATYAVTGRHLASAVEEVFGGANGNP